MLSVAINILGILIIYQTIVFMVSLLTKRIIKPFFVKALIAFCLLISVHFSLMLYENYLQLSYFFGPFFGLLYGPLYFLYARSLMFTKMNFRAFAIHFAPAFLILLGIIFFKTYLVQYINGLGLLVTAHFVIYLVVSLKTLFGYRNSLKNNSSLFHSISLTWLEIIIYIQSAVLFMTIIESYVIRLVFRETSLLIIYALVLGLINCFYHLGLKQVQLFKGLDRKTSANITAKEYSIPEAMLNSYATKLLGYMTQEAPYLEFNISLHELSGKLDITPRNLSYVINTKFNKNFYDFINTYRLNIAKELLTSSKEPVKNIMYDSGFANKATFNTLFKKHTGLTPTQYRLAHTKRSSYS